MLAVGYPLGHAALCGLFAKAQGEGETANISTRMGWFGASACAARLLALLLARGSSRDSSQHMLGESSASVLPSACIVVLALALALALAVGAAACVYFRRALCALS